MDGPLSDEDAAAFVRSEIQRFAREFDEGSPETRAQSLRRFMVDEETAKRAFGALADEVWPICRSSIELRESFIGVFPEVMTFQLSEKRIAFGAFDGDSPDVAELLAAIPDDVRVIRSRTFRGDPPAIYDYVIVDGTVRAIPTLDVIGHELVTGRVERAWEQFLSDAVSEDDDIVRRAMTDFMVDESTLSRIFGERSRTIWPAVESLRKVALTGVTACRNEVREKRERDTSLAVFELDRSNRLERVRRMRMDVLHALVPEDVRFFSVHSIMEPIMFQQGDDFGLHCVLIDGVVRHIPPANELVQMLEGAGVSGDDYAHGVDWARAEDAWFDAMQRGLAELPEKYPEEVFYGAFFDCNSGYMGIQLHLNTEAALRETVEEYRKKHPDLDPGQTVEDLIEEFRWDAGDWTYFSVSVPDRSPEVQAMYSQLTAAHHAAYVNDELPDLEERYMELCCRVVIRLEQAGAIDRLRRTSTFRVLCVEEDESVEDGEERLARVRALLAPGKPD